MQPLCITCKPEDLDQGLFGHVFTNVFQVLPYLYEQQCFPAWEIRTLHYGEPPNLVTIPGALELAYEPPPGPYRYVELNELRRRHGQILGNDWAALAALWSRFFRVPARVQEAAGGLLPPGRRLGIHYRGNDKQTTTWDSNPITQEEYLSCIAEFLSNTEPYEVLFAATDEQSFVEKLRASTDLPVIALDGEVDFHLAQQTTISRTEKCDRAMLDCLLLSQCDTVIETSSALPSFAKLLNPAIGIYRCAASKLFSNMPYFPVAYIPVLPLQTAANTAILERTMVADWSSDPKAARFHKPFAYTPRWPRNHRLFGLAARAGMEDLVAGLVQGYR